MNELRKDLKVVERNGLVRPWHERALKAGEKWAARILQELKTADVIVCQLRRDFLASDFCVLTEPDTALRRKDAGEAELIAYVLKDCRLETDQPRAVPDSAARRQAAPAPEQGRILGRHRGGHRGHPERDAAPIAPVCCPQPGVRAAACCSMPW